MSSKNKLTDQHLKMLKNHFGDSSKSKPNKRPNQKTNKHKRQKRLGKKNILNFPFNGRFIRGNENGFSFIANSIDEDYFAHISNNVGARVDNMKVLDGKECAFIIGGSPFAYNNKKPRWENVVIQWALLTELKIPDGKGISEYSIDDIRKDYFDALNIEQFIVFLKAEWYVKLWEKRANTTPKSHLIRDSVIEQALGNKIGECESLKDLEILFNSTCKSYWFEEDEKEISSKYFHPKHWNESIFLSIDLSKVDNYLITKYKKTIQRKIISKRSIAIDLETDGQSIFQYGWYNTGDKGILVEQKGIKTKQLQDSITLSIADKDRDIVIGHNINAWDLPILKSKKIKLSNKNNYWDTLIISWLLEPWKQTHALINKNNAHQADSDAKVTYQLFTNQLAKLNTILFSGNSEQFDTFKLIESIFLNPDTILDIVTDFGLDIFPKDFEKDNIIILTETQLNQMGWIKNLNIKIFDSSARAANPILDYDTIKMIAEDSKNIFLKLISIVLYNASKNKVQIFLSMIPNWLISNDKIKSEIIRLHSKNTNIRKDSSNTVDCHLINDILKLGNQARNKVLSKKQITVFDKKELLLYWSNTEKKEIKEKEVEKQYPEIIGQIKGQSLFKINNSDIMSWVFYETPGLKDMVSHWSFLPPFPEWLNQIKEYQTQDQNQNLSIVIPSWIDGDTSNLPLDRIFVSHSTKNRILYLSDVLERSINVVKTVSDDTITLIAMKWGTEADQLQKYLVQLEFSSDHSESPLRNLEHVKNKGFKAMACSMQHLSNYINAAKELKISINIIIEQLPVYQWYVLDYKIGTNSSQSIEKTTIRNFDLIKLVNDNLYSWVSSLVDSHTQMKINVFIIDSMLMANSKTDYKGVERAEVPFFGVNELFDNHKYEVFKKVCFPKINKKPIPKDYNSYKRFLNQNWGFPDFRKGTQKPAIEKIIESDKDIILRLPTGAGKSIIFHLPALLRSNYSKRLTIVITPLRALMKDQVDGLRQKNFHESVDYLSGGRESFINYEVYQGILDGRIKLLFIAPERFRVEKFINVLERRREMDSGLEFIVFDEAHCISEWGFEFRPDYLYASNYLAAKFKKNDFSGNPHRFLLTSATVTERNRLDLEGELALGEKSNYHLLPDDMPHPIQSYISLKSYDLMEDEESPMDEKGHKMIEILSKLDLGESAAIIFVRRRKDCHRISEFLNNAATNKDLKIENLNSLPFHAGLPESIKAESVELLKEKNVNVLVCTKAFGMGMDIPHIHASIHHRPTTYIEDFLQEVGRIGRDEEERKRRNLKQVEGTVLFNQSNIDNNLSLLNKEAISHLDLDEFFEYIKPKAVSFDQVNRSICYVESKIKIQQDKEFNESQVTRILFWLERMDVLKIEGRHPPVLSLTINRELLESISGEESSSSKVGLALLNNIKSSEGLFDNFKNAVETKKSQIIGESIFNRVIKSVLGGVVSLINWSEDDSDEAIESSNNEIQLNISMQTIMAESGGLTRDDVFTALMDLGKSGAVHVVKNFNISVQHGKSEDSFFKLLNHSLEIILDVPFGKVHTFKRKKYEQDLKNWYRGQLLKSAKQKDLSKYDVRKINREVIRVINTSLRIFRYANIEIDEQINSSGEATYSYVISQSVGYKLKSILDDIVNKIRKMHDLFESVHELESQDGDNDSFDIKLEKLFLHFEDDSLSFSRIIQIIKLVESSGFFAFNNTIDDWVTVISFETTQKLEPLDITDKSKSRIQKIYREMEEKNELQQLRAQSMILLLAMPEENRRDFIDKYFGIKNLKNLQKLLEDTIGNIPDEFFEGNSLLSELLGKVRRERFIKEMKGLNPNQRKIVETVFDKNILVNAGPGSGKTHVLMMRCAHLIHIQKLDPSEILVLAFNRAVVFEIKDRVAKLFRDIGYGNYADRLKVYTFHSFALQHVPSEDVFEEDAINDALHTLAENMNNAEFASQVASTYKAVLIDEFQDMNEDFYKVIENIIRYCGGNENSRGGGMVIGDDDQDILMWNRIKWAQRNNKNEYPLHAVQYFSHFEKHFNPDIIELNLNYRSTINIISRANSFISNADNKINIARMKSESLQPFRKNEGTENKFSINQFHDLLKDELDKDGNIAVLCRSNDECRYVFEDLMTNNIINEDGIEILGSFDLSLYQRRDCGALLDIFQKRNDYDFIEQYVWEEIIDEYLGKKHVQHEIGKEYLNKIFELVKKEVGRPKVRDIKNFISEMKNSDVDRLTAKTGHKIDTKIKISTIHKVKGLEFDTVFLMPSKKSFPLRGNNIRLLDHSAEEARLYFVAITRAKNKLFMAFDNREISWYNGRKFGTPKNGVQFSLKGEPDEFLVSWPGNDFKLQNFIERHVPLNDEIKLDNNELRYEGKAITKLSRKGINNLSRQRSFRISNIMRYSCGEYYQNRNPQYYQDLCRQVKERGWFYLPLVEQI